MTTTKAIDIAIVGGGFAGAAAAYHLAHIACGASITVFEPRAVLGGGLAYDDSDPAHRINVPATRMSLLPNDESHFARWLAESGAGESDPDIVGRDGAYYPRRGVFGRYVAAHLAPLIAAGRITHVRSHVLGLEAERGRWKLTAASGAFYRAKIVVLATTHPAPDLPAPLIPLAADRRLIADSLLPGALDAIGPNERVVIIGTGLTMADVVASLDRQGHRGSIVAISRRGLRSRGHAGAAAEPFGDFATSPPRASALLHRVRATIREAAARGISWHSVIDAVRAQAQTFWPKLSPQEQSRIVRHLRVYWDVHRFRVAPQVEDALDRRAAAGTVRLLAAPLVAAAVKPDHIEIAIRHRKRDALETLNADRVVVTTGPAHARILSSQHYLAGLAASGTIKADHLGLGIACDSKSRALGAGGATQAGLFIAGPLARATFGELMGLPQVSAQALAVAEEVARSLALSVASAPDIATAK